MQGYGCFVAEFRVRGSFLPNLTFRKQQLEKKEMHIMYIASCVVVLLSQVGSFLVSVVQQQ